MVKFPELIMQFRDRTLEMSPGGSKFTFSPGKKSSDPPKLQGKNRSTPPKLQGKNRICESGTPWPHLH